MYLHKLLTMLHLTTRPPLQIGGMFCNRVLTSDTSKKIAFFAFYTSVATTIQTNFQTILGGGTKMVAGAIVHIERAKSLPV